MQTRDNFNLSIACRAIFGPQIPFALSQIYALPSLMAAEPDLRRQCCESCSQVYECRDCAIATPQLSYCCTIKPRPKSHCREGYPGNFLLTPTHIPTENASGAQLLSTALLLKMSLRLCRLHYCILPLGNPCSLLKGTVRQANRYQYSLHCNIPLSRCL